MQPWEDNSEAWKQESDSPLKKPKIKTFIKEIGLALRPKVEVDLCNSVQDLKFKTRDHLLQHLFVKDEVIAYIEETNEWFQYSATRNLWIQIQKV